VWVLENIALVSILDAAKSAGWPRYTNPFPKMKKQCIVILAGNYGEAGALGLYGDLEADTQTNGVGQFKPLGSK
jgi:hypothetical protein